MTLGPCLVGITMSSSSAGYLIGNLLLNIKRKLVYPVSFVGSFASTLTLFILQVSLWKYAELGTDQSYIVSYFAAVALLRPFLTTGVDRRLQARHGTGDILYDTMRPRSLAALHIVQDVSSALTSLVLVSLPVVIVISLFFPIRWVPISVLPFFMLSASLSFLISWNLAFVFGCMVFFLKNNEGVLLLRFILVPLLSGALVPIDALPSVMRKALYLLPFRALYDLPTRVFTSDRIDGVIEPLLLQGGWLVLFLLVTRILGRISERKLEIFGG